MAPARSSLARCVSLGLPRHRGHGDSRGETARSGAALSRRDPGVPAAAHDGGAGDTGASDSLRGVRPHAPPAAQESYDRAEFLARAAARRRSFMRDTEVRAAFQAVIESLGLDPAATCADRLILRLQPSGDTHRGRRVRYLPPHRDTWGSNVMAQINLWGPVFPLEPGATMVIWLTLFGRPVPNTSADWDFEKLREAPGRYPLLPECRPPRRCAGGSGSHRAWRSAVLFRGSSACQQAQPDR